MAPPANWFRACHVQMVPHVARLITGIGGRIKWVVGPRWVVRFGSWYPRLTNSMRRADGTRPLPPPRANVVRGLPGKILFTLFQLTLRKVEAGFCGKVRYLAPPANSFHVWDVQMVHGLSLPPQPGLEAYTEEEGEIEGGELEGGTRIGSAVRVVSPESRLGTAASGGRYERCPTQRTKTQNRELSTSG